jgi:transcriptional regulator GlxA family with amidase domain
MRPTSAPEQWDSDQDRSIRATGKLTADTGHPTRVSIVAISEAMVSPVSGLFEAFKAVGSLAAPQDLDRARGEPFEVEIVGERAGTIAGASGLTIGAHRAVHEIEKTDIVIVPSMALDEEVDWVPGRHPAMVGWIRAMYERGATVCSACTGGMLTAEAGLLDGQEATIHWVAEPYFRERHPEVVLRLDEALVISGDGGRLVTSGAATAWHDLALYLVARHVGPATAQALARFNLLEWHQDGQAAFQVFEPGTDHGDAVVLAAQRWIADNYAVAAPVAEMVRRSGLTPRTFKRRFRAATGETTISYVQRIRIERAKRALETGNAPIEEISWAVGYEDAASFRRLFKRLTGVTPGEYRRRFQLPDLPHVPAAQHRAAAIPESSRREGVIPPAA